MASTGQRLVVVGAGGFGREVMDVIDAINEQSLLAGGPAYEVLGFLADPAPNQTLLEPYGVSHLGSVDTLGDLPDDVGYVIAIGNSEARRKIDELAQDRFSPVLVDPTATVRRNVTLGPGTVICAGARLTNHISVGRHVHINLNATVGHDATIGDYATLSPLVGISGNATIGDGAFLGTGAVVNPGVTVGAWSVIGSGAAAIRDVPSGVTAVGVPARQR